MKKKTNRKKMSDWKGTQGQKPSTAVSSLFLHTKSGLEKYRRHKSSNIDWRTPYIMNENVY